LGVCNISKRRVGECVAMNCVLSEVLSGWTAFDIYSLT